MITQHSWMFLSVYESLRRQLFGIDLINMAHLGTRAFEEIGGEVVQTTTFVMRNARTSQYKATYCRLVDYLSEDAKRIAFLERRNQFHITQELIQKIPGNPIAYWVSEQFVRMFNAPAFFEYSISDGQNKTGNNAKYLREFWEISNDDVGIGKKWLFYAKGGGYRKWYGNLSETINWSEEARSFYRQDKICRIIPEYLWYKVGITWSLISNNPSFRILPEAATFDVGGSSVFLKDDKELYFYLGLLNSKVFLQVQQVMNPTINIQVKDVRIMPVKKAKTEIIESLVSSAVDYCKEDWDSFETSWDFERHPLVKKALSYDHQKADHTTIEECFRVWSDECDYRFNQLKSNEEKLNRIFIEVYGLQNELSPGVEDKDVTARRADLLREIKSLLSYAVGCMFGRYSLGTTGLAYAGGKWDEHKYNQFKPDADNIIPISDEEYLEDDIVTRLCTFLKVTFGESTLEENLDFIAKALGNKGGSSRDVIRNYFLNDFFKDHCQTYSVSGSGKRPIYWLFDSGKQNGFKALIYLHRYNADTIGNLRIDYLHRMQRIYESEISRMQDMIDHSTSGREVAQATKRREKLAKQLKECREYDEKLAHLALSRIELDLDDGVKKNYRKIQTANDGKFYEVLADSKNIMAKE